MEETPEQVVGFVRRQVELPEGMLPVYRADRTAKHHRGLVREWAGVAYDQAEARRIAEQSVRKEAAAENRPADLINIALEKVVEAGLELPGFSTFDKIASKIRTEVNASICAGIHDSMSPLQRTELLRLLEERDADGTTLFNRLKKPAKGPSWSHFKNLTRRMEWLDGIRHPRTGARWWSTGPVPGSSSASTSRRWSSPTSPRNCAAATSRFSARRSTATGPSSCWPGRWCRTSWPTTWWRSGCASRVRPPSSTPGSSVGSWRTSSGPPPQQRTPGTWTTRAWSLTRRRVSRR
ncbi:DUF4158 domain-containing protein [Streptomyces sp. NPDC056470]|uniref:DUF4158 domain-containing protein n=1 Tax=Streptomyces sp. NPDC056470 TaxID=3345831 RepID=UPI00369E6374